MPIARADIRAVGQRVERSHKPAAESGHVDGRDAVGEFHEVVVGDGDVDLFGERTCACSMNPSGITFSQMLEWPRWHRGRSRPRG